MKDIKICLNKLAEKNIDMNINRTIKILCENLDENQLEYKLSQGIVLDNGLINLYFYKNMGFKCNNSMNERYGNLPLCNYIEKNLKKVDFPFLINKS